MECFQRSLLDQSSSFQVPSEKATLWNLYLWRAGRCNANCYWWNGNPKIPTKTQVVSQYAREGIQRKLQQLLPCDFHIAIKGSELELYIPEYYKWKIIGKGWTAITNLEKDIGLRIHVRTFNELPLLEVKVDIAGGDRKGDPFGEFPFQKNLEIRRFLCLLMMD